MNYYFFLNFEELNLDSSVEIFNSPPISKFYKKKIEDKKIVIFYSKDNKWNYFDYGIIKKNTFVTIKKSELPSQLDNQSLFIYLSDISSELSIDYENDYNLSLPEWRSNIKIISPSTSCSYQGELPNHFKNKKLSLISCSPMVQQDNLVENYFILVNLSKNPTKNPFDVEILNSKKKILDKTTFYTNTINKYSLKKLKNYNSEMFIFKSSERGGLPLYFSRNIENKSMSLEHTHPPQAYFIFGDTFKYQKIKKNYWFS